MGIRALRFSVFEARQFEQAVIATILSIKWARTLEETRFKLLAENRDAHLQNDTQ
jgi:hypothetical protein